MKKWICLLMLLSLLLCWGCKKAPATATTQPAPTTPAPVQPTAIGTWTVELDMASTISEMVHLQTGAPTVSVSFPVKLTLTLNEEGTYTLTPDQELLTQQLDYLGIVLWQLVVDQAAGQSYMSPQDTMAALSEQGKSKELLMQQLDFESFFENALHKEGLWRISAGQIHFADTPETLESAPGYPFALTDQTLTLTYETATLEPQQATMVFQKVQ